MEALDFGKYNFFIWASYGLTFIVLAWNVFIPWFEKKKLVKRLNRRNYLNNIGSNDANLDNKNEKTQ